MKKKKPYRHKIRERLRGIVDQRNGRNIRGDSVSVQDGKGKFMVTIRDRGGIKEGWSMDWYPYTVKSVEILRDIMAGRRY